MLPFIPYHLIAQPVIAHVMVHEKNSRGTITQLVTEAYAFSPMCTELVYKQ